MPTKDHEPFTDMGVVDKGTGVEVKLGDKTTLLNYDDAQALSDMLYVLLDDIKLEENE